MSSADKSPAKPKVAYLKLYRYASRTDKVFIAVGFLAAAAVGCDILGSLYIYDGTDVGLRAMEAAVTDGVLKLVVLAASVGFLCYIQLSFWIIAGENQTRRIRQAYFEALLRQEIAWFDQRETGELTARLATDISLIQDGLSDKVGLIVQGVTGFLASFVVAFLRGWELTLILLASTPCLVGAAYLLSITVQDESSKIQDAYGAAGSIAQQAIASIRTIVAFGVEPKVIERYNAHLNSAERSSVRKAMSEGLGVGTLQCVMFLVYALAFWYGAILIGQSRMNESDVVIVFFSVVIGAFLIGQSVPYITAINTATAAAYEIFATIDRKSLIDPTLDTGLKPELLKGAISFKDVSFAYPTRPESNVLNKFSVNIAPGKKLALVGMSGSGKSTIVKLLERFYEPTAGSVSIDGIELHQYNLHYLRSLMGLVSQEPVLFNYSIKANLLYGLPDKGRGLSEAEIDKKVRWACEQANAWEFVAKLPLGLDTIVGEAGTMLSGGQKQRIAIARAIINDPKILILDEATSALDTESERMVQASIDRASKNRTTISIAHRLSTIKEADEILVLRGGNVVEQGSHQDLLAKNGIYSELVKAQEMKAAEGAIAVAATDKVQDDVVKPTHKDALIPEQKAESDVVVLQRNSNDNMRRFLAMSKPEALFIALGFFCAAVTGTIMPVFAILFARILSALRNQSEANFLSLCFVLVAIAAFFLYFGFSAAFGYVSAKLTRRVREIAFRTMLKQEIGYFDEDENNTGALTRRLAEDARLVPLIGFQMYGTMLQVFSSVVAGLVIGFYYSWQMTLVLLGTIPLVGLSGLAEFQTLQGFGLKSKKAYEKASQVANDAISGIRTIAGLSVERVLGEEFFEECKESHKVTVRGAWIAASAYAISQTVPLMAWALAMWYGSRLLIWRDLNYAADNVVTSMFSIIFSTMILGQLGTQIPDMAKSKVAVSSMNKLLDRRSAIDATLKVGKEVENTHGMAKVSDVRFAYPTRPKQQILNGISAAFLPGKTVALVGHSGCGKSTVVGLLERWYDVTSGYVEIEGLDAKQWKLTSLRSHMALVGQEPVLFNLSIRENIAYGVNETVDDEMIYNAAKLANAHNFVMDLPEKYETLVGEKGGQLSGGQKQRIAIARALIRNPKVLLLDEATSALDSESEKTVQEALDSASKGRTTIVIAHRLSTIQNADLILVIENGSIIESGIHSELIMRKGRYSDLVDQQKLASQ